MYVDYMYIHMCIYIYIYIHVYIYIYIYVTALYFIIELNTRYTIISNNLRFKSPLTFHSCPIPMLFTFVCFKHFV